MKNKKKIRKKPGFLQENDIWLNLPAFMNIYYDVIVPLLNEY